MDGLDKVIYGAIVNNELKILETPKQLSGLMLDMAPALKKEIYIFSKTVNDKYALIIKSAFEQNADDSETSIKKLRYVFIEEKGLSEAWINLICDSIKNAILYFNGIGTIKNKNIYIEDFNLEFENKKAIIENVQINTISADNQKSVKKKSNKIKIKNPPTVINKSYNLNEYKNELDQAETFILKNKKYEALEIYRQIANKGCVPAYNMVADSYYGNKNFKKAWKWYMKAAEESYSSNC